MSSFFCEDEAGWCRHVLCGDEERLKDISKKDRENVFVEHEVNKHNSEFRYRETKRFKMTI